MTLLLRNLDGPAQVDLPHRLDSPPLRTMTARQFDAWYARTQDLRAEWANGEVVLTAPDNIEHGDLELWLARILGDRIEQHNLGTLHTSRTQIRPPNVRSRREPDLLFVARSRRSIVRETHIAGAPDLIMEIVSPDSAARDWREKYLEYEKARVREYWVIDPAQRRVEAYALRAGEYRRIMPKADVVHSRVLKGLFLRESWLWQRPLPKVAKVLAELKTRP